MVISSYALVLSMARPRTVHFMGDLDGFGIALAIRLSSRNRLFTVSKATLSMLEDTIETMGLDDGNNQYSVSSRNSSK